MTTTKIKKAAIEAIKVAEKKYGKGEVKHVPYLVALMEPVAAGLIGPEEIPEEVEEIHTELVTKYTKKKGGELKVVGYEIKMEGLYYTEEIEPEFIYLKTVPVGKEVIKMLEGLIKGVLEKGLILK